MGNSDQFFVSIYLQTFLSHWGFFSPRCEARCQSRPKRKHLVRLKVGDFRKKKFKTIFKKTINITWQNFLKYVNIRTSIVVQVRNVKRSRVENSYVSGTNPMGETLKFRKDFALRHFEIFRDFDVAKIYLENIKYLIM